MLHEVWMEQALILKNKIYFFYNKYQHQHYKKALADEFKYQHQHYKKALADEFNHIAVVSAPTLAINWTLEKGKIINKTELKLNMRDAAN